MSWDRHLQRGKQAIRRGISGPQMLAFLPAICLAAYWLGGELFLILAALAAPLVYTLTGGFGSMARAGASPSDPVQTVDAAAERFLEAAQRNGQTAACLHLEIAGYTEIARSLGDDAVASTRKLIFDRVASQLRDQDAVFQTGETRLIVLLAPGYRLKLDALLEVAKRLRGAVEEPVSLDGSTRFLTTAIGLASSLSVGRSGTVEDWMDAGAQALAEARANGVSATRAWSDKLSEQRRNRTALREDLRAAFDQGQIQAHFQPQVSVRTGQITGMEALARWHHPDRGIIPPAEFLRAIDESGQMDRLGQTMLVQSLTALHHWDSTHVDVPAVSVNFSATELRNPALADKVKWELDRFGLTANRLGIEVLESVVADMTDGVIRRNLAALADHGCRIDLDDFGTGNASITTLQRFPIQRVKIDRSFVSGADRSDATRRMLAAILGMADRLNLETLAEGVETVNEFTLLNQLNCHYAQGYLFSPPLARDEVAKWCRDQLNTTEEDRTAPPMQRLQ